MADDLQIELSDVNSKYIKQLGYHPESKTLGIAFHNGKVFHYSNVPQEMFDAMKAAESIGKYFHANIRGRSDEYPHKAIGE